MPIFDTDAFPPALRAKTFKPNIIVLPFEELRSARNGQNYVRISQTPESMNAGTDPAFDPINFRVDDNMFPVGSVRSIRERGDNSDVVYLDGQKWLRMGAIITDDSEIAAVDNKAALLGMGQYSIGYTAAQTGLPNVDRTTQTFTDVAGNGGGVWLAASANKLYRSTDDGITWASLGDMMASPDYVAGIAVIPIYEGASTWFYLSTTGSIYKSTNDGTTWTLLTQTSISINNTTGVNFFKYRWGNLYFIPATQITVSTPSSATAIAAYKFNLYDAAWTWLTYDSNLLYLYSNNVAGGVSVLGSWHDLVETNEAIYLQGRFTASGNRYLMHLTIIKYPVAYAAWVYTGFISGNNNTTLVDAGNVVWANTCTYNTPTSAYVQRKAWLAKDLTTSNTGPGVPSPLSSTFFYYTSGDIVDNKTTSAFKRNDVFYKYGTTIMPRGSVCLSRTYFNSDVQTSTAVQTGTIVNDSDFFCADMAGDTIVQMCTFGRVVRHRPHIGTHIAYKTNADMASYVRVS